MLSKLLGYLFIASIVASCASSLALYSTSTPLLIFFLYVGCAFITGHSPFSRILFPLTGKQILVRLSLGTLAALIGFLAARTMTYLLDPHSPHDVLGLIGAWLSFQMCDLTLRRTYGLTHRWPDIIIMGSLLAAIMKLAILYELKRHIVSDDVYLVWGRYVGVVMTGFLALALPTGCLIGVAYLWKRPVPTVLQALAMSLLSGLLSMCVVYVSSVVMLGAFAAPAMFGDVHLAYWLPEVLQVPGGMTALGISVALLFALMPPEMVLACIGAIGVSLPLSIIMRSAFWLKHVQPMHANSQM